MPEPTEAPNPVAWCACGVVSLLQGTRVQLGNVLHTTDEPCYVVDTYGRPAPRLVKSFATVRNADGTSGMAVLVDGEPFPYHISADTPLEVTELGGTGSGLYGVTLTLVVNGKVQLDG